MSREVLHTVQCSAVQCSEGVSKGITLSPFCRETSGLILPFYTNPTHFTHPTLPYTYYTYYPTLHYILSYFLPFFLPHPQPL